MNLIDILDIYSLENGVDDMFLMFGDYTLDNRIDRNVMNTTIISELGNARPITTDPDLFKILFDNFFNKYSSNITKLVDTMYLEYNPLHTKDITREMNEKVDETENRESVGDIDNTDKYSTTTDNVETQTHTGENQVSAYDSQVYQPKDKSIDSQSATTVNGVEHSGETTSDIKSTVDTDKDTTRNVTETIQGKDGDTSYQSLIEQERKLSEFNIFNWIIKQMRRELFLLIY